MRKILFFLIAGLVLGASFIPATAQEASFQATFTGTINNLTPFREFPFTVEEDNSLIVLDIMPSAANPGNLDTYLYLVDAQGNIIDENDDRERGVLSSRIEFPRAEAGQYTAIATRYGVADGQSTGDFELLIEVMPQPQAALIQFDVSPEAIASMGFPQTEIRPEAEWTVLAYYGGDNNLEYGLQFDFNEFELAGGSSENVRVLMLLDRSPEHSPDNGDWRTMRIFEVGADVSADETLVFPPTLDTEPLADLGVVDTGNGEVLAQYLVWAVRHFPAQNYAVSLASHGAAWQGIITDDTVALDNPAIDYSIISVPELSEAFRLATAEAGVERFNVLINDACLMSSVEYFGGVSPYFDLSLASPEIVVDPALDMTLFVNQLKANAADVNLVDLSSTLVDKYVQQDMLLSGDADVEYFNHAVTDLSQFGSVIVAVEEFARVVNEDPLRYANTLGAARANTYTYTGFAGSTTKVDLGSFMQLVIDNATDGNLIEAAIDVNEALTSAILHRQGGANVGEELAYYNIYFPASSSRFSRRYFDESPLQQWGLMLRNYYNAVTPQIWTGGSDDLTFHAPVAPKIEIVNVYPGRERTVNTLNPLTIDYELVGRNISFADAIYDQFQPNGSLIRLSSNRITTPIFNEDGTVDSVNMWDNGVNTNLSINWDVALPVLTDGTSANNEFLIDSDNVAFLDGQFRQTPDDTFQDVTIVFSKAINQSDLVGRVQRVINRASGSNALAVIDIPIGSEFVAYRSIVQSDGRVVVEPGNTYIWPVGGLTYTDEPAPNGEYKVGILVEAYGGTTGFTSRTVNVDNSNINPDLRGQSLPFYGVTLIRPADWSFFGVDADAFRSVSNDGENSVALYIAIEDNSEGNLEAVVDEVFGYYFPGTEWDRQYTEIAAPDGRPAIEFTFMREDDGEMIQSKAIAVFTPETGFGLVITSEGTPDDPDIEVFYQQLKNNLTLFDPTDVNANSTSRWFDTTLDVEALQPFTPEVEYSMLESWQSNLQGLWTRYTVNGEPSTTFMAFSTSPLTDATAALDNAIALNVLSNMQGYAAGADRVLTTDHHTWTSRIYDVTRDGQVYKGRMYATVENNQTYLIWMETPETIETQNLYTTRFEPIVDSFQIALPEESE